MVIFDYIDFEKVVFGWQQILRYFELGKSKQVVIDYDPEKPKIKIIFLAPDENGVMSKQTVGSIDRLDCERFFLSLGEKFVGFLKMGEKQRIIVEYDPQNEKASIEFHNGSVMRFAGSSGISADIDS